MKYSEEDVVYPASIIQSLTQSDQPWTNFIANLTSSRRSATEVSTAVGEEYVVPATTRRSVTQIGTTTAEADGVTTNTGRSPTQVRSHIAKPDTVPATTA